MRRCRRAIALCLLLGALSPPTVRADCRTELPAGLNAAQVELGRHLFFDSRLSRTGEVSCASCHDVVGGGNGADHARFSRGVGGQMGGRNTPTVWNAALRTNLFWDGRAASLEEQARGPITNPVEMGMEPAAVVQTLDADPQYRAAFERAFAQTRTPDAGLSFDEVTRALAAFERTLLTCEAPFDRYRRGDETAISEQAREGWQRFNALGCIGCHGTPTFSTGDYFLRFPVRSVPDITYLFRVTDDEGRVGFTDNLKDRNVWRIPSLRNVALTAPYFHNGSVATLEQAVRVMGRAQLNRVLADGDLKALVAFLESLTGERPSIEAPRALTAHRERSAP